MSENLKTIRELADELGVSKQAIWKVGRHVKILAVRSTDSINRDVEKRSQIVQRRVAVCYPIMICTLVKTYRRGNV